MYFQKLIIKSKRLGHQKQPIHATNLKFHNIFFHPEQNEYSAKDMKNES